VIQSWGYAAPQAKQPLAPFSFQRRNPRPDDIVIEVQYCGVCHSDLHQVRDEWGASIFPMVPGHEIMGTVVKAGSQVKKFKEGDRVGVGCMVNSCGHCVNCVAGEEQYCENGATWTYNARDNGAPTYGGYSNNIVVKESFGVSISPKLDLAAAAPLLCAGVTTYSPLRHWKVGPGSKVGVVGLGGLGHMALKFAHAFGAHVVQFTTSINKEGDARRLGADEVVLSNDPEQMKKHKSSFDFILDTVSAKHDMDALMNLVKVNGTLTMVGLPDQPTFIPGWGLIGGRRSLAGSAIGGIRETQEMLDYCADQGIVSDIEMIPIAKINEAYVRMLKSDVKYRFVIDLATLPKP
jgi:alcohol dehydrogenase (NADP+)